MVAALLGVAGCGGSSSSDASSSSTGDNSDAQRVKLQQCLRDNGVDVPDNPTPGAGGGQPNIDRDKLQKAISGPCKEFQQGAGGNISSADRQEMQDSFQKFAQCMRDNGVDVPDIGSGGGPPAGGGGQLNQDDPKTKAASEKCQDKLPQNLPGQGGQ
jgi:hypothetical protein